MLDALVWMPLYDGKVNVTSAYHSILNLCGNNLSYVPYVNYVSEGLQMDGIPYWMV